MTQLHTLMREKIDCKHVEPNSGLGQAYGYLLKHWTPLTLFLREAGAPFVSCQRHRVTGGVKCSHDGRGQKQPPRVGRLVMKEG
jgi:hypothetical protein